MANESSNIFNQRDEELKLVKYYQHIVEKRYEISTDAQKGFMMQLLNTKISQIEPQTNRAKIRHYILRIGVFLFSAISTIVLGLQSNDRCWPINSSNIALILTAIITFLSALASFWDTEAYWIRLKVMLNKLKQLRYEFAFNAVGEKALNNDHLKIYLDKFIAIQADEYWENYVNAMDKS